MDLYSTVKKMGEDYASKRERYIEKYKSYEDEKLLSRLKHTSAASPRKMAIVSILKERGYEHSDSN